MLRLRCPPMLPLLHAKESTMARDIQPPTLLDASLNIEVAAKEADWACLEGTPIPKPANLVGSANKRFSRSDTLLPTSAGMNTRAMTLSSSLKQGDEPGIRRCRNHHSLCKDLGMAHN